MRSNQTKYIKRSATALIALAAMLFSTFVTLGCARVGEPVAEGRIVITDSFGEEHEFDLDAVGHTAAMLSYVTAGLPPEIAGIFHRETTLSLSTGQELRLTPGDDGIAVTVDGVRYPVAVVWDRDAKTLDITGDGDGWLQLQFSATKGVDEAAARYALAGVIGAVVDDELAANQKVEPVTIIVGGVVIIVVSGIVAYTICIIWGCGSACKDSCANSGGVDRCGCGFSFGGSGSSGGGSGSSEMGYWCDCVND